MLQANLKTTYILSVIILALAAVASAGGLFLPGLYRDNPTVTAAMRGNDLITLVVAVPLLAAALFLARRRFGSKRTEVRFEPGPLGARMLLVWMGLLVYMLYNYVFYLYGTAFNPFFLLYVALTALSVWALIFGLPRIDAQAIARQFRASTPVKGISAWMVFFALLLGGLWIAMSLGAIAAGKAPDTCAATGSPTCIVFATDLTLLVPGLLVSAILLWQRRTWGYILTAMMLVKACTYGVALLVMGVFALIETGSGDSLAGLWAFLTLGCLVAMGLLMKNFEYEVNHENTAVI